MRRKATRWSPRRWASGRRGWATREAAAAAVTAIGSFLGRIGHPVRLSAAGVKEGDLEKAAALSLSDGAIVNNPRPILDAEEVLYGRLPGRALLYAHSSSGGLLWVFAAANE